MKTFYFEMTDAFGGETNYAWLSRFTIHAKSLHGALIKLSRKSGFNFRYDGYFYRAKRACVVAYEIEEVDDSWLDSAKVLGKL